jgi:broad specificity phosphatase PhoE
MSKTTLYLVRHGESIGNKKGIILGHTDLDLTELGYQQAQMTADALRNVEFSAAYSSDLMRASNTATRIAEVHNLDVILDEQLREFYIGDWEGVDRGLLREKYGELFYNAWNRDFGTFIFPNGECVQDGVKRIYSELQLIAERHEGETILATFHAATIRGFWGLISGIPKEKWGTDTDFPSNASYSIVEYDGEKFVPISYSNDEHMGELITKIKL